MGILDDLAMGFGLKERTADYDARTARGVAVDNAVANAPNQQVAGMMTSILNSGGTISPSSSMYQYINPSDFGGGGNDYSMANLIDKGPAYSNYLTGQGYSAGNFPQPVDSGYSGLAKFLFSAPMNPNSPSLSFNPTSPTPVAIGPFEFDEPIDMPLPGVGMVMKALEGLRPKPLGDKQFIPYNPDALDVSMDPLMAQGLEEYFDMYTPAGTKQNPNY